MSTGSVSLSVLAAVHSGSSAARFESRVDVELTAGRPAKLATSRISQ